MGVEGRDLVDFGHGEAHLGCERCEMPRGKAAVVILDPVQVLDEQVAAPGLVAQQRANFLLRCGIDLPAFLGVAGPAAPAAGVSGCLIAGR